MGCPRERLPTSGVPGSVIRCTWPLLLGLSLGGCRTSARPVPRYIVTVAPINLVGAGHPGLCIAVDPADAQGVWWWEPGPSGCSSRTTGPTVFRAPATVAAPGGSGDIEVRFQLQLMSGVRDVRLLVHDGGVRETASGALVSTERRRDLDIPPAYGR
jgi:hypothetical protein